MLVFSVQAWGLVPTSFLGMEIGKTTHAEVLSIAKTYSRDVEDGLAVDCQGFFCGRHMWDKARFIFNEDVFWGMSLSDTIPDNNEFESQSLWFKQEFGEDINGYGEIFMRINLASSKIDVDRLITAYDGNNLASLTLHKNGSIVLNYMSNCGLVVDYMAQKHMSENPNYDEANRVESVAGLKFGEPKSSVKLKLSRTMAYMLQDEGKVLDYANFPWAGEIYDAAKFYFGYKDGVLVLTSAHFERNFESYEKKQAQNVYNGVLELFRRKYTNVQEVTSDSGEPLALCGMIEETAGRKLPPISISMSYSASKSGKMYYYVVIDYYLSNQVNVYNDEI